jgi:hypothetical protein
VRRRRLCGSSAAGTKLSATITCARESDSSETGLSGRERERQVRNRAEWERERERQLRNRAEWDRERERDRSETGLSGTERERETAQKQG